MIKWNTIKSIHEFVSNLCIIASFVSVLKAQWTIMYYSEIFNVVYDIDDPMYTTINAIRPLHDWL
jgi:hypothetical protein